MPAFSFTAPQVTPDMELAERETLPDHVWFGILNDMNGWETSPMCNQTVKKSEGQTELPPIPVGAIEQVLYEMSKLPLIHTKEYREAQAQVPQLVQAESAVEGFLRCEKFDCQEAAKRLAYYWKIRFKLFGPQKAFLPMISKKHDQDGGALGDDIKLLESGFLTVHAKDERGRTVLCIDRIKATPPFATRDASLRCLFWIVHVLVLEDPLIQINGCVCLLNIKGYDLYRHFDRLMSKHISIILHHCMPLKLKAMHLLVGRTDPGVMSLVLPSMKQVMGKDCRLRTTVHSGTDRRMLETLKPFGIERRNVSEQLGGDFTQADFVEWWSRTMTMSTTRTTARNAIGGPEESTPTTNAATTSARTADDRVVSTRMMPTTAEDEGSLSRRDDHKPQQKPASIKLYPAFAVGSRTFPVVRST